MRRARSRFRPARDCPMPGTLPPPLGFWSQEKANADDGRAANSCAAVLVPRIGFLVGALEMPRYQLVVRHFAYADVEDNEAGTELPNDAAAAREFAAKVMRGLLDQREDDWHGWTMEVREGRRRVWQLPFDAIEPTSH